MSGSITAPAEPVPGWADQAYQDVSTAAQRVYRSVSYHPGPHFRPGVAAAAAGADVPTTQVVLDELAGVGLLRRVSAGRYGIAVRGHAWAARRDDPAGVGGQARRAVITYYRELAQTACAAALPHRREARQAVGDAVVLGPASAMGWLASEHLNLINAALDAHDHTLYGEAWQIIAALEPLYRYQQPPGWVPAARLGARAAEASGDPVAHATMLDLLGTALLREAGNPTAAAGAHRAAQKLWRSLDDRHRLAASQRRFGDLAAYRGDHRLAAQHFTTAADLDRRLGDGRGVALAEIGLGHALVRGSAPHQAIDAATHAKTALTGHQGDPYHAARAGIVVAEAFIATRQFRRAGPHLHDALHQMKQVEAWYGIAEVYDALTCLADQTGNPHKARHYARLAGQARTGCHTGGST